MILRLVLVLCLIPAMGWSASWRLDPESRLSVDVAWGNGFVEVRFPSLSGVIEFDERRPETARATITVATGDVSTGVGLVDALVRSRDYLDAAQFPAMTFELDRLVPTSRQSANVHGRVTLRGVTLPVSFAARVFRYAPSAADPDRFEAGFNLTGAIDRTAFGSTGGLPEVGAVLPVRIRLIMTSR